MSKQLFSPMEIDAIGEIMNISLGSSATAVSNMLDHRVDVTTPRVSVMDVQDFTLDSMDPAIGVEIKYITGLKGSNIMLLKMSDIHAITDILLGQETAADDFTLDELTVSAVCEVMNQMMGAASTALSDLLGRIVNISPPHTFDVDNLEEMKREHLPVKEGSIVVVRFALKIENAMKSEFMNVISVDLAKELVAGFGLDLEEEEPDDAPESPHTADPIAADEENDTLMNNDAQMPPSENKMLSQEEIEAMMAANLAGGAAPGPEQSDSQLTQEEVRSMPSESVVGGAAPAAQPVPGAAPPGYWEMQQQMQQMMLQQMQSMQQQLREMSAGKTDPKVIQTRSVSMPKLEGAGELDEEQSQNLDLIMSVPLEISVEIGRTRKKVKEILALSKGSLVVLDKLAGEQVDLYVNGKCIAHGDVVVIDDNFGIRISEIVRKPSLEDLRP